MNNDYYDNFYHLIRTGCSDQSLYSMNAESRMKKMMLLFVAVVVGSVACWSVTESAKVDLELEKEVSSITVP